MRGIRRLFIFFYFFLISHRLMEGYNIFLLHIILIILIGDSDTDRLFSKTTM